MSAIPITVTGTVATEPAARTLPSGRACASFRLAVNHWRVDRDTGEFVTDGTSWFSVDCYGDLASNSSMSLRSGTAVIVTGTLKIRQWETEERSGIAPTVVAEHIGPDLRYGTAHYRRSKAPERAQNSANQAAGETGSQQSTGWGPLAGSSADGGTPSPGSGSAPSVSRSYLSPETEAVGAEADGPSADGPSVDGREAGTVDEADGRSGPEGGTANAETTADAESAGDAQDIADASDAAITRATADAAAPF